MTPYWKIGKTYIQWEPPTRFRNYIQFEALDTSITQNYPKHMLSKDAYIILSKSKFNTAQASRTSILDSTGHSTYLDLSKNAYILLPKSRFKIVQYSRTSILDSTDYQIISTIDQSCWDI